MLVHKIYSAQAYCIIQGSLYTDDELKKGIQKWKNIFKIGKSFLMMPISIIAAAGIFWDCLCLTKP